jgi:hypothetical protein
VQGCLKDKVNFVEPATAPLFSGQLIYWHASEIYLELHQRISNSWGRVSIFVLYLKGVGFRLEETYLGLGV